MRSDAEPQEVDERDGRLIVARVRPPTRDPRLSALLGMVAVLVGLAVLKPWGVAAPAPSRAPGLTTAAPVEVTPEPTADRSAQGLASPVCLGSGSWQVASLERWRTQAVRVWRAIEPVRSATGPLDRAIPSSPIVAVELTALGWCAPAYGPAVPIGPVTVTAWWVEKDEAAALRLVQVQPPDGVTPLAALYRPVAECQPGQRCLAPGPGTTSLPTTWLESAQASSALPAPARLGAWTSGRVVLRWVDAGAGTEAWFAADIQMLDPDEVRPDPWATDVPARERAGETTRAEG
jgi:hypothetical protein